MEATRQQADDSPSGYLPSEPWNMGDLVLREEGSTTCVEMFGYAFSALEPDAVPLEPFLMNGNPFSQVSYPLYREDLGRLFWVRQNSALCGFACSTTVPTSTLYPNGAMELTFVNPGPARLIQAQQSWFRCDPARELPLPDEDRRFRVIGTKNPEHFTFGGFTDFKRLDAAIRFFTGKGFADWGRILDFGCGCGRVARYVSQIPSAALTGFDIDSDNVSWCTTNLAGHFVHSSVRPPVALPSNSFDLVYGISVFTHLREAMQDMWLAELARLCAPGAFLFMTVHGQTALNYALQGPKGFHNFQEQIRTRGLYESDTNHQIDGFAEHEGEYVNVFHDQKYIESHWSAYFEIVAVVPGYIYTHDLIVMRKLSSLQRLGRRIRRFVG